MNILLPTYSYYPYNYGGTEIYVSGLAKYLIRSGHQVTVIAGMPPAAFEDHKIFFEDEILKTVEYFQDELKVIGVLLKRTSVTDIYRKHRPEWVESWGTVIQKLCVPDWDILHVHANTSAIGFSLIKAVKLHSPKIKTVASYHVPLSCVKGTLLFGNKMEACAVTPTGNICTACFVSDKKNWPIPLSKFLVKILPKWQNDNLPTNLRLKFLVNEFIVSFNSFGKEIDEWHVFSKQIGSILLLNLVEKNKIRSLGHGVNAIFNLESNHSIIDRLKKKETIFLYAGRFDKNKGFFTLLNAWCSLPESAERTLWIVGEKQNEDAALDKWLHRASRRKDITWMGALNQQNLALKMKQVHCTIIPSECIEIGPLIFHEAIAAGSDVIASDIGGCKELGKIYKDKATLFNAGESNELVQKIMGFKFSDKSLQVANQFENYSKILSSYNSLKNTENL